MSRFERKGHVVYNVGYHIIWIPKYRVHILKGTIKNIVEIALSNKAKELGIKIEKMEIMPDHIHLFIKSNPNLTISYIVGCLKGYSSYKLRSTYPKYRKYKALWAPSYYCETVGHISETTIKKYVDSQWDVKS